MLKAEVVVLPVSVVGYLVDGMVVSKGRLGCVVLGVFAKRPAFASSVFFILALLFVPTGGGGRDADRWRLLVS
jgi:hypothetical protein